MRETHQGVPEEFIFGIVLPEEEFAVAAHGGLNLNHQLVVLQISLCTRTRTYTHTHGCQLGSMLELWHRFQASRPLHHLIENSEMPQ